MHGTISTLVAFAFVSLTKVDTPSLSRRLSEVAPRDQAEQAILKDASDVSVVFSGIFFFIMGVMIVSDSMPTDLQVMQRSTLKKRVEFALAVCLYICFFSCLFNFIQYGEEDDLVLENVESRDLPVLDLARPIEWMLTCPLMQLCIPILGGENVKEWRRWSMPLNSFTILCFGMSAMLSWDFRAKLVFYLCGVSCFCVLVHQMNCVIMESTNRAETICYGSSMIRKLVVITTSTWIPFPVWYALSPEGFNIIPNSAGMKIAVAFLNVWSKGVFIYYLARVNADLRVRENAMSQIEVINEMEGKKKRLAGLGEEFDGKEMEVSTRLAVVVEEVLTEMGRGKEVKAMMAVLASRMINNTDDVMVLTKEYCEEIALPYGFVMALKTRIKFGKHQVEDAWDFKAQLQEQAVTQDAGIHRPLPPQVANDPRKLKEHHRRMFGTTDEDFDNVSVGGESTRTTRTTATNRTQGLYSPAERGGFSATEKDALQVAISSSQNMMLDEIRSMRRQQMEQSARVNSLEHNVNKDLGRVGENCEGAITKVMSVIDQRLQESSASTGLAQTSGVRFSDRRTSGNHNNY
jgi:bacteriorhodopsin